MCDSQLLLLVHYGVPFVSKLQNEATIFRHYWFQQWRWSCMQPTTLRRRFLAATPIPRLRIYGSDKSLDTVMNLLKLQMSVRCKPWLSPATSLHSSFKSTSPLFSILPLPNSYASSSTFWSFSTLVNLLTSLLIHSVSFWRWSSRHHILLPRHIHVDAPTQLLTQPLHQNIPL